MDHPCKETDELVAQVLLEVASAIANTEVEYRDMRGMPIPDLGQFVFNLVIKLGNRAQKLREGKK